MSVESTLKERSNNSCELCGATDNLSVFGIPPQSNLTVDDSAYLCSTCIDQIEDQDKVDPNHWRCLNESMWSEVEGVKVLAWRMLNRLRKEGWPQDLLDMMYLEEDSLKWAKETGDDLSDDEKIIHKDSNGAILQSGDSVVLIQDLKVKGGGFTAKRGTAVKRISLVHDNAEHIEGKVDGQQIVILTKYVKKTN